MSRSMSLKCVLATAMAGFAVLSAGAKESEDLSLKSDYSGKFVVDGARRVFLTLTLDDKGNGSGTLSLDPNIVDEWGSTCIAVQTYSIRARVVESDEQAVKGRRLYELKKIGDEGIVEKGSARWFLIRPLKEGSPTWLVFADENGRFQDILAVA